LNYSFEEWKLASWHERENLAKSNNKNVFIFPPTDKNKAPYFGHIIIVK